MISLLLAILSLQFILVLCKKEQKSDDEAAGKHAAPVQSTYRRYTSPRQSIASRSGRNRDHFPATVAPTSGRNREQDAPSEAVTEYDNVDKKTEQREISMNSSVHDLKNNS